MRRKHAAGIIALLLAFVMLLTSCSAVNTDVQGSSSYEEETEVTVQPDITSASADDRPSEEDLKFVDSYNLLCNEEEDKITLCGKDDLTSQELMKIPGVVHVAKCSFYRDNEYLLFFENLLDHKDPSRGTFIQLIHIVFKSFDAPNCFYIGGYEISYAYESLSRIARDNEYEDFFASEYSCNYIEPEYRLYARSVPEGLDKNDPSFWEVLTCAQAADDFHQMIEAFKTRFGGRWCLEGHSKGGEAVTYHAAVHPEDGDMFLSEAGMVLLGQGDKDLYEYAYTTAGDLALGKEKAALNRDTITKFQIQCLENREDLAPVISKRSEVYSVRLSPEIDQDILLDLMVLDYVYYWQTIFSEDLTLVNKALALKDGDRDEYIKALADALFECYGPWQYQLYNNNINTYQELELYKYLFQSFREEGHYGYDYSYLKDAIRKAKSPARLRVTPDMEDGLWDLRIDPVHRELFPYDPAVLNARKDAVANTKKPLFFINGLTDIYHTHEVTKSDNENVHIFNIPHGTHEEVTADYLSPEQKEEFDRLVRKILEI